MWLPLLALVIGLIIGLQFSFTVPQEYARYTAVGILAALDAILGAVRAELNHAYDNKVFITGLLSNVSLAVGLTFLGDRLGVDLILAAVVAFGVRMFDNVAIIRRHFPIVPATVVQRCRGRLQTGPPAQQNGGLADRKPAGKATEKLT